LHFLGSAPSKGTVAQYYLYKNNPRLVFDSLAIMQFKSSYIFTA
jgi:hypothetical protein